MADGAGVEEIAFVPGTIVQAVLNSSQNGVNLHSVVVRYTSTYLQDVASGDSAEEVMESLPSTGPEWVTTFEEAWHASAEKIMPEFVRARSAVWAGVSVAGRSVSPPPGPVGLGGASAGASKEIFKVAPIERDETIAALMDGLVVSDHDFDKAINDIKVQRISGARMMALSLALVSGHVHPMGDSADLRFGSDMRLCPLIKQQRKAGVLRSGLLRAVTSIEAGWVGQRAKRLGSLAAHVRFLQWAFRSTRGAAAGCWRKGRLRAALAVALAFGRDEATTRCAGGANLATAAEFAQQRRLAGEMLDWYSTYVAVLRRLQSGTTPFVLQDFVGGGEGLGGSVGAAPARRSLRLLA